MVQPDISLIADSVACTCTLPLRIRIVTSPMKSLEHEIRRATRLLKIHEEQCRDNANSRSQAYRVIIKPVVHLTIDHDIAERAAHKAEHHNIAELGEGEWRVLGLVGVVGHTQQSDEYSHEYCAKHGVVDHLPMVVVGKPCRNPCANLSEQHKEEIDDRLACLILRVESVPSCLVHRFVARRNIARCLDAEAILDECEEVAHDHKISRVVHIFLL